MQQHNKKKTQITFILFMYDPLYDHLMWWRKNGSQIHHLPTLISWLLKRSIGYTRQLFFVQIKLLNECLRKAYFCEIWYGRKFVLLVIFKKWSLILLITCPTLLINIFRFHFASPPMKRCWICCNEKINYEPPTERTYGVCYICWFFVISKTGKKEKII